MTDALTERQLQVLRWLDENPSNRSRWLVNGRDVRGRDKPEDWSHMEISGPNGSIIVAAADVKALALYRIASPSPEKMWGPNEKGRAALTASRTPA
jgi:hypothetical protein